jgi:hypothetical protein
MVEMTKEEMSELLALMQTQGSETRKGCAPGL